MALSYIEKEILETVKNLREPSITRIKRRCGLSIPTIKNICKKLVDNEYLKDVDGYRYCITDKGLDFLSILAKPKIIDNNMIKDIASQVAEQIGKQISGKRFITGITGQERDIKIKTDFIPQIEDETGSLDSNIMKLGVTLEKEKSQKIEESAKLLKNVRKRW